MLKEQIERSVLMGIGLISLTREKAQAYVEDLVKEGKAASSEVTNLTEKLVKRGEEERNALRKVVREEMNAALKDVNIATADDIQKLQAQVEALKAASATEETEEGEA